MCCLGYWNIQIFLYNSVPEPIMKIIADLHIHSRFSRATSKELNLENLEKYARIKGLDMLGTGDFTHPLWLKELKSQLSEEDGILYTKSRFPFVLQGEISLMYSQGGKGRKVHNIVLAPGFGVVEQINEALLKKGRLDYDGRPIFGMGCVEFVELMKGISGDIEIIPAHVWTPWFGLFGSMSGFDSVKECFQEQSKHIHALESGLSSDPAMNWRLSSLDSYSIVSFSDSHSFWPWRMGREATIFDIKMSYAGLIKALKTREGLTATIEVDPNYGKYHFDGHRNCGICMAPKESLQNRNICPLCKKPVTIGVLHRVDELADRKEGFKPEQAVPFFSLIPLHEIISKLVNSGISSQKTWAEFNKLIDKFDNELNVLLFAKKEELEKAVDERLAEKIIENRNGRIKIQPGYDGEYGYPVFDENDIKKTKKGEVKKIKKSQKDLTEFLG